MRCAPVSRSEKRRSLMRSFRDCTTRCLDVNMVQRMTDSGRRFKFAVTVVVGNGDGFVGLGRAKGKEVGPTIRRGDRSGEARDRRGVARMRASWESAVAAVPTPCRSKCGGRSGSVVVTFRPAPLGVGLAVGDVAKPILRFAGITDAWGFTQGHTKTTVNYAQAAFQTLLAPFPTEGSSRRFPVRLKIVRGAIGTSILPPEGGATRRSSWRPWAADGAAVAGDRGAAEPGMASRAAVAAAPVADRPGRP